MPTLIFNRPELTFPVRVNAATVLLRRGAAPRGPDAVAVKGPMGNWTFAELDAQSNRIANLLTGELGLVPGNRVLLRAPNNPMTAACLLGILKAGAIAVPTMPLLRAKDLAPILRKAQVGLALCDDRLVGELRVAAAELPGLQFVGFGPDAGPGSPNRRLTMQSADFTAVDTAADDIALIAFTSGTTGEPKGTMHFHRDILAVCASVGDGLLGLQPGDIVIGSPPLAFAYGLGVLLAFPLWAGACTVLLESARPEELMPATARFGATVCSTAPTAYRIMLRHLDAVPPALRCCVSAGEHLPADTFLQWRAKTGISIINGIGTTEMLHMFAGSAGNAIRPGAIGRALPGYDMCVIGADNEPLPAGQPGRLAVRGPTGCRYLADARQREYVIKGWNVTGDICSLDAEGYLWYHARADDMIVSGGYNISGPEVEQALLPHPAVQECAVVAAPDAERGNVVKAFVVTAPGFSGGPELTRTLQEFVRNSIAPYKYPRLVEYVDSLPRTCTGKLQRNVLRERCAMPRE
jgi:2-aminobenzoate-CoA ligase